MKLCKFYLFLSIFLYLQSVNPQCYCDTIDQFHNKKEQLTSSTLRQLERAKENKCPRFKCDTNHNHDQIGLITPLSVASNHGSAPIVQYFLKDNQAPVINYKNIPFGRTPLIEAASSCLSNHEAPVIVEMLLNEGADPEEEDNENQTALDIIANFRKMFPDLPAASEASCSLVEHILKENIKNKHTLMESFSPEESISIPQTTSPHPYRYSDITEEEEE